jgi:uncharacterized membrane protein YedE/YeeE
MTTVPSTICEGAEPAEPAAAGVERVWAFALYLGVGIGFGWVLVRAEIVSWFRIQEMFRFQAFHMFGIIGSAIAVAALSIALLRRFRVRSLDGQVISLATETMGSGARYVAGGFLFGVGWAFTGACPGPLFALVGSGAEVMLVALASALAGTWTYGLLRARLPH